MRLDDHLGAVTEHATVKDIALAVRRLTSVGEAFLVLSDGDDVYLQAAGTLGEDFVVERRDGRASEHYRGDRRVSAAELVALLEGYLRRSADWGSALSWHRVDVEGSTPSS